MDEKKPPAEKPKGRKRLSEEQKRANMKASHDRWYAKNRDKVSAYHKAYHLAHREKLIETTRKYMEQNADRYKQRKYCACGGYYTYFNHNIHNRTKMHQKYLEEQKDNQED